MKSLILPIIGGDGYPHLQDYKNNQSPVVEDTYLHECEDEHSISLGRLDIGGGLAYSMCLKRGHFHPDCAKDGGFFGEMESFIFWKKGKFSTNSFKNENFGGKLLFRTKGSQYYDGKVVHFSAIL